jgi:cell division protein FtsL
LLAALERLSSHRLLDRLLRGRAWIGLVTFALIGIVTLQLAMLKLNGTVGRALERQAQLQRENASLSIENSELAAADRVQAHAAQMGMEFAPSSALRFLTANPHMDFTRGAAALSARSASAGAEGTAGRAAPATSTEGGSAEGGGEARAPEASGSTPAGGSSQASSAGSEASPAPSSSAPAGGEAAATRPQAGSGEPSSAQTSPAGGSEAGPSG